MVFDAGAVSASLTIDTSQFSRDLDKAKAEAKAFADNDYKVKISAVFDTSSMSRARQMFADLDNAISKDAMGRLRSSPQGSVLGSLNALFSPHPVTGGPSASQSAAQGLLGQMVTGPDGGTVAPLSGGQDNGSMSATEAVRQVLTGQGAGDEATTDEIRQVLTGQGAENASTTDDIRQVLTGTGPGDTVTTDTVKEALDQASAAQTDAELKAAGLEVTVPVKESLDETSAAATEAELRAAGAPVTAVIREKVDTSQVSGKKDGERYGSDFLGAFAAVMKGSGDGEDGDGVLGAVEGALNAGGIAGGALPGITGISGFAATVAGLGASLAAALPAITAVGAGMGVLAGGIVLADKADSSFGANLKTTLSGMEQVAEQAALPLVQPVEQAFTQLGQFVTGIGPELQSAFADSGAFVQPLTTGLEGLVSGLLPGLLSLLKDGAPAFSAFSDVLSTLGRDLGDMFTDFAPVLAQSGTVMTALLDLVSALFPVIGELSSAFATSLAPVITDFTGAFESLLPAVSAAGQVIGSFASAVLADLGSVLGAGATLVSDLAPSLNVLATALEQSFSVLENAGVFATLGDSVESLAPLIANLVNSLVTGLAPALPPLTSALSDLSGILVSAFSAGLGAALAALTPVAAGLAGAAASVVTFLGNSGLLVPALAAVAVAMLPVSEAVTGLQAAFAAVTASGFVTSVTGMIDVVTAFTEATDGLALADKALVATELVLEAVSPLAWAASGAVLLGALAVALVAVSAQSQTVVGEFQTQESQLNYNISSYQQLAAAADTAAGGLSESASKMTDSVRGGAAGLETLSKQLGETGQQIIQTGDTMQSRVSDLSQSLGVSQTVIEQWAHAAGISSEQFGGSSENVGKLTAALVAFVDKNASAVTASSSLSTNVAILGDDVFSATAQLDAFNAIWNTLVGNLLTKQTAVTQSAAQFQSLQQTIASNGKSSEQTAQSFQSYISEIGSSVTALLKVNTPISQVNSYLQAQIDNLKSLGPLNKDEQADLNGLVSVQTALANSTRGLSADQLTYIQQTEQSLIPDLLKLHADTPLVNTDIKNLADAIAQTGDNSAATESDRAQLIKDLENAGVSAQDATTLVDELTKSLNAIPANVSSTVTITEQLANTVAVADEGSGPVIRKAAGGYVTGPGGPTDDDVPAWLSNGEYVLSAAATAKYGLAMLDAINTEKFSAGGIVGTYGISASRGYVLTSASREYATAGTQGGGMASAAVLQRLDRLIDTTAAVPAGVGKHVGGALSGAAHDASWRARYPRGGS